MNTFISDNKIIIPHCDILVSVSRADDENNLIFSGNTAQLLCVRNAVGSFVRETKNNEVIPVYVKEFLAAMTDDMQVYDVQSRQAVVVRHCLK